MEIIKLHNITFAKSKIVHNDNDIQLNMDMSMDVINIADNENYDLFKNII